MFLAGNVIWLSEVSSVSKKYNNTNYKQTKMKPFQASLKRNEKVVFNNIQDEIEKNEPKYRLRNLVRTADIEQVFSMGD